MQLNVIIMKVYIEMNRLQVEPIRCRDLFYFIHVYFCKAANPMPTERNSGRFTNNVGSSSDSLHGCRDMVIIRVRLWLGLYMWLGLRLWLELKLPKTRTLALHPNQHNSIAENRP